MSGSMRERRPGVWELRTYAGRDPLSGRKRWVSRTVHGGKRDAQDALDELVVEVRKGDRSRTEGTLGGLLGAWLELIEADRSPTTIREYRRLIDRRIIPALGGRPVRKLEAADLDAFYGALRRGGLSPASIRQVHAIVRRALGQAVRWGWIPRNPATLATPPPVRREELRPPSPAEVVKLLRAADEQDPDFGVLLRVAAATGARRGEVCALRWADVDLEGRVVTIGRSIADVKGGWLEKPTKTHGVRRVVIDEATAAALDGVRERRGGEAERFVFSHRLDGVRPLAPMTVTQKFRRLCRATGVRARLHDLRHFHATRLLDAGVPLRTVSGRLGHAKSSTTSDIYSHWVDGRDAEAAEAIGKLLGP